MACHGQFYIYLYIYRGLGFSAKSSGFLGIMEKKMAAYLDMRIAQSAGTATNVQVSSIFPLAWLGRHSKVHSGSIRSLFRV